MNEKYQDFLSLGSSLRGGEDKIEEVRLGLLGFRRDVEGLRDMVEERRKEVEGLLPLFLTVTSEPSKSAQPFSPRTEFQPSHRSCLRHDGSEAWIFEKTKAGSVNCLFRR